MVMSIHVTAQREPDHLAGFSYPHPESASLLSGRKHLSSRRGCFRHRVQTHGTEQLPGSDLDNGNSIQVARSSQPNFIGSAHLSLPLLALLRVSPPEGKGFTLSKR